MSMRRKNSLRKADVQATAAADALKEEMTYRKKEKERAKKREKNLSLDIRNYQRKTMLNGIDQLEQIDEAYDLVQAAKALGIDPLIVSNFKGMGILENLHELKIWYDSNYFNRQTYEEFRADPLGAKLLDQWAATDKDVIENVKSQKRLNKVIQGIADNAGLKVDLSVPSLKKQEWLAQEEKRKKDGESSMNVAQGIR